MYRFIIITLLLSSVAVAQEVDLYKSHMGMKLSTKKVQKVFDGVLKKSKTEMNKLKPNVDSNAEFFLYYTGIEVSLDAIDYKTFNCSKKGDLYSKLLFDFDPKHRKEKNMPTAVSELMKFMDSACK